MKPLTIINCTDVTVKFKDKLFHSKFKMFNDDFYSVLNKEAYKQISYLTNMYVYSCLCMYNNKLIEYKVQSGDYITSESIFFLN